METVGERLRHARKTAPERGVAGRFGRVTQADLANLVGLTRQAIVFTENGKNNSTPNNLAIIAEYLRVCPLWLITGQGEMSESGSDPEVQTSVDSIPATSEDEIISEVSAIHALTAQILENSDKGRSNERILRRLKSSMEECLSLLR